MNLAIDFGNTRIKTGLFEGEELIQKEVFSSLSEVVDYSSTIHFQHCIISNVSYPIKEVQEVFPNALQVSAKLKMPFENDYSTPHTLGVDRLALVAGAMTLASLDDLLAIDLGTCITYDFLQGGRYQGGAISPGVNLRSKALHNFTHKLPLVETIQEGNLVGDSTIDSILSGLINGVAFEVEGFIVKYQEKYPNLKVFLSGGDAEFFESKINQSIFVEPNLALLGLNKILLENN